MIARFMNGPLEGEEREQAVASLVEAAKKLVDECNEGQSSPSLGALDQLAEALRAIEQAAREERR